MDIEDLIDIELHDLPLDSIFVDFVNQQFCLNVTPYDDDKEEYLERKIRFIEMNNFEIDGKIHFLKTFHKEINWTELEKVDDIYFIEIICLQGFGEPSFSFKFNFTNVILE
jgi:hypothetical protein